MVASCLTRDHRAQERICSQISPILPFPQPQNEKPQPAVWRRNSVHPDSYKVIGGSKLDVRGAYEKRAGALALQLMGADRGRSVGI